MLVVRESGVPYWPRSISLEVLLGLQKEIKQELGLHPLQGDEEIGIYLEDGVYYTVRIDEFTRDSIGTRYVEYWEVPTISQLYEDIISWLPDWY